jgi:DNA-binding protein H-NS
MSVVSDVADVAEVATTASPIGAIFTSIKLYVTLFVIGAIVAGFFGIRWYISSEQTKIDTLTKAVATQQVAITQDEQAQALMQTDLAAMKVLTDSYSKKIAAIQTTANKVSTTFNSTQFQAMVKTQPSQAQSEINTNINQLFQDVNDASRATTSK